MKTTSKKQYKLMAANDNNAARTRLELGSSLSKFANGRKSNGRKSKPSDINASDLSFSSFTQDQVKKSYKTFAPRPPNLQALFLLALGFTLTSVATLAYVLLTAQYTDLIPTLITSITLGGLSLTAMRSGAALWGSLVTMTIWTMFAAVSLYNHNTIPLEGWTIALPAILGLLIIMAGQLQYKTALRMSLVCTYIWLGIFTVSLELSALSAGSLIFIFGTAHHRLGKVCEDKDIRFGHDHTLIGWIAAMLGLIWTQHYFIPLGSFEPNTFGILAQQSFFWLSGIGLGLCVIIVSSLLRIQHNHLSWLGFIHIVFGCLILPLIAYQPELMTLFEPVTTLKAIPYLGFTLGAIVIALSLGLMMNGLRRRYYVDAVIGAFAICMQFVFIFNPDYMIFDLFPVLLFTVMFVLCFELIISRQSILMAPMSPKM